MRSENVFRDETCPCIKTEANEISSPVIILDRMPKSSSRAGVDDTFMKCQSQGPGSEFINLTWAVILKRSKAKFISGHTQSDTPIRIRIQCSLFIHIIVA